MHPILIIALLVLAGTAITGCGHRSDKCVNKSGMVSILLFNGTGTSTNDVKALETILSSNYLNFSTVNTEQLNGMSELQMRGYRLLIIPGGNFMDMGKNLSPGTAANIGDAVHNGLNYLGICAGGFLAGDSHYYNCFRLTPGASFNFYSVENQGTHKTAVAITSPGAPTLEHYWEDGPQFSAWGAVVGKYPDSTPAIVQGTFGSGCVILSGVHPEAPADWRRGMSFNTPASTDNEYAGMLISAALNRTSLPHY